MHCEINEVHRIDSHKGPVYAITLKGDEILSGGSDRLLLRHSTEDPDHGQLIATFQESIFSIYSDETQICVGGFSGHLYQIFQNSGQVRKWEAHDGAIFSIIALPESRLASAGADGKIHIWDISKMQIIRTIWLGDFKIRKLFLHSSNHQLAVACGNGSLIILDLTWFNTIYEYHDAENACLCVAYLEDKELWITGHKNGIIHFWRKEKGESIFSFQAHQGPVYDIQLDHEHRMLFSCSQDKSLKIWNIHDLTLQLKWDHWQGSAYRSINQLALHENQLIMVGDNSKIDLLKICFFE